MDIPTLKAQVTAAGHAFPKITNGVCLSPFPTGYGPPNHTRTAWGLYNCRTGTVAFFDTETFAPVKI